VSLSKETQDSSRNTQKINIKTFSLKLINYLNLHHFRPLALAIIMGENKASLSSCYPLIISVVEDKLEH